ncbi:peptidoglycan editing factor PgeF [Staphylococcus saprophyticus]|nr:peptidoglycan editing factor PgeF [Staphylococcus saprophyticus]
MQDKFIKKRHILEYEDKQLINVKLGITTREDGLSPYPQNAFNMARYIDDSQQNITKHQEMLATVIGFPREQWVFPIQTHENKVVKVTSNDKGTNIDALNDALHGVDALYTYEPNLLLTMCYADCVPIYFYSEKHHFIGLAHAGWRGTVEQIVNALISNIDFDLNDLNVVIGPATSTSYEINDDIKSKFETLPIDINQYIDTRGTDRHGIDLKRANALLLENAGVPKDNIYITNYATSEDLSLFFSYRVEKGNTGRMLAFIGQ